MTPLPLDILPFSLAIPGLRQEAGRRACEFHYVGATHGDDFDAPPPFCWENTGAAAADARTHHRLLCDLRRAESRDYWLRWLADGVRCPRRDDEDNSPCDGTVYAHSLSTEGSSHPCRRCKGTGWLRPAHACDWMRDGQKLSPELSAACIAWSVREVAVGGWPLRGVLAPWLRCDGGHVREIHIGDANAVRRVCEMDHPSGDSVRARADSDLLARLHHYAHLDENGMLTLPDLPAAPTDTTGRPA